jgi:hypothetical protein
LVGLVDHAAGARLDVENRNLAAKALVGRPLDRFHTDIREKRCFENIGIVGADSDPRVDRAAQFDQLRARLGQILAGRTRRDRERVATTLEANSRGSFDRRADLAGLPSRYGPELQRRQPVPVQRDIGVSRAGRKVFAHHQHGFAVSDSAPTDKLHVRL